MKTVEAQHSLNYYGTDDSIITVNLESNFGKKQQFQGDLNFINEKVMELTGNSLEMYLKGIK